MDAKQTLINLHRRFPEMSLDDLFSILECVQEYVLPYTTTDFTTPLGPKIY